MASIIVRNGLVTHTWQFNRLSPDDLIRTLSEVWGPATIVPLTRDDVKAANTGACLCTSFRTNGDDSMCLDCGHEAHPSRNYCGGIPR